MTTLLSLSLLSNMKIITAKASVPATHAQNENNDAL